MTGNVKRGPKSDLSRDDEVIVRGWAVEHGLERVARIVVALAETKPGRGYSTESEALQRMVARHLADPTIDFTSLATEAAALIHPKPAGRKNLIKRMAESFSAGRVRWVWFAKNRKPPAPSLPSGDSRPSSAHERVIHRIAAMFDDDAIELYNALLKEPTEKDSDKLLLIGDRKKKTIEILLSKRLKEHQTGEFTKGANRTARTLFDLIAWDLNHPNGDA